MKIVLLDPTTQAFLFCRSDTVDACWAGCSQGSSYKGYSWVRV